MKSDLEKIPTLFAPVVPPISGMDILMQAVTTFTSDLGYTQPGVSVPLSGTLESKAPTLFAQFVHQHMQAYLDMLELSPRITIGTFFDPRALLPT